MTTSTPPAADPAARPLLVRPREDRMLAGVAAGTAAHLRLDPFAVRIAYVLLATLGSAWWPTPCSG